MPDELVMTPAELAFVEFVGREHGAASPLGSLLHLPDIAGTEDPMLQIGLQSLVARHLASIDGSTVDVEPRVAAIGGLLSAPDCCVGVLLSVPARTDASQLIEGFGVRAVFTPVPPQLQHVSFLDLTPDLAVVLASVVTQHALDNGESAAAIVMEYDALDPVERGIAITHEGDGRFRCVIEGTTEAPREPPSSHSAEELEGVIRALVGSRPAPLEQ